MGSVSGHSPQGKICYFCGLDCAGQPRGRDPRGRYYHQACFDDARRQQAGAGDVGIGVRTPPIPNPAPGSAARAGDESHSILGSLLDDAPAAAACPGCGSALAGGAIICTSCGYDMRSGGQLLSQFIPAAPPMASRSKAGDGGNSMSGAMAILLNPYVMFCISALFVMMMALIGRTSEGAMFAMYVLVCLLSLATYIVVIVFAFMEGIAHGILAIICGIYNLYYGLAKIPHTFLRGLYGGVFVGSIAFIILNPAVLEREERRTQPTYERTYNFQRQDPTRGGL